MVTEFDADTALDPDGDGRWRGELTDRWFIGAGLNGGYLASVLTRALVNEAGPPHPLTMTTHFMARAEPGPVQVAVERVRTGRSHETLTARLEQDGPVAMAIATFGQRREGGPQFLNMHPPELDDPDRGHPRGEPPFSGMTFLNRFDFRFPATADHPMASPEPGKALFKGWVRLKDRDVDDVAIPLIADCFPPPVFALEGAGLAPTIELTTHWRGDPEPEWTGCRFESRTLSGGYVEEDGEIWSRSGKLIAQSRQLSRFSPARQDAAVRVSPLRVTRLPEGRP